MATTEPERQIETSAREAAAVAKHVVVAGPTASGKGALAFELARQLHAEIVSVDSMKIYRGMDIATAKPSAAQRSEVRYHLIDIADPCEEFSVGRFLPLALERVETIESSGRPAVLQGGTALYLNALFEGFFEGPEADRELRDALEREADERGLEALWRDLSASDPEAARRIHPNDRRRIVRALEVVRTTGTAISEHWKSSTQRLRPGSYRTFGIALERQELYRRIDARVLKMVERGLFEEVERFGSDPRGLSRCASMCIGYRQIIDGMREGLSRDAIVERIQRDTRRFAKQQMTWFRRFDMEWLTPAPAADLARDVLARMRA